MRARRGSRPPPNARSCTDSTGAARYRIAGHATITDDRVSLRGLVASLDGKQVFEETVEGPVGDAEAMGISLAEDLLGRGADKVLASLMQS